LPTDAIAQAQLRGWPRDRSEPTTVQAALNQIFGEKPKPVLKQPLKAQLAPPAANGCSADPIRLELLMRVHNSSKERLSPEMWQLDRVGQQVLGWPDVDAANAARQKEAMRYVDLLNLHRSCDPLGSQSSLQGAVDAFLNTHRHLLLKD
jgi:hypothetical protein